MRRTEISVSIKGKDVTKEISKYLTSISYTDKPDDQLDDLQLILEDRERLFQGPWMPQPGEIITATFRTFNWGFWGETGVLDCGDFEVDEVELESSMEGGDVVTIRAVPAVVKSSLMNQKKTRAWSEASLSEVVSDIAGEAGLATVYIAPQIVYERIEQRAEHDLEFIQRICKDQGLRVKIKKGKMIVYMGQTADQRPPIEFERKTVIIERLRFKKVMAAIFKECRVTYNDASNSEEIDADFTPGDPPKTGKVLTINKRVEHPAQAERLARAELRDKNSQEITGNFTSMGSTKYVAGRILQFKGWSNFDRKYVMREVRHEYSFEGGYVCDVDFELALDY